MNSNLVFQSSHSQQNVDDRPIKVKIAGTLEVEGSLVCKGDILSQNNSYNEDKATLIEQNRLLENRIKEIEKRIEMLWYAPGMPGFVECQNDYYYIEGIKNNRN